MQSIHAQLTVSIPPAFAGKELEGIKSILDQSILKHVPSLKGVLLSYSQIESLEPSARLMYDSPYSHIRIRAHFHTFSPEVGDVLDGIVNKVSPDHIGLLIYGVFNASIPSDQIRKSEFAWDSEGHTWMRRDDTQTPLEPGSIFRFTVKEVLMTSNVISIIGSLLEKPVKTGLIPDVNFSLETPVIMSPILSPKRVNLVKQEMDLARAEEETEEEQDEKPDTVVKKSLVKEDGMVEVPVEETPKKKKKKRSSSAKEETDEPSKQDSPIDTPVSTTVDTPKTESKKHKKK